MLLHGYLDKDIKEDHHSRQAVVQTDWFQAFQKPELACRSSQKLSQQHRVHCSTRGSSCKILRNKCLSSVPDGQSSRLPSLPAPGSVEHFLCPQTGTMDQAQLETVAGYNCVLGRLSRAEEEKEHLRRLPQDKTRIFCNNLSKSAGNIGVLAVPLEPNQNQDPTVLNKHTHPHRSQSHVRGRGAVLFPRFPVVLGKHKKVKAVVWHFDESPAYFPEEPSGSLS